MEIEFTILFIIHKIQLYSELIYSFFYNDQFIHSIVYDKFTSKGNNSILLYEQ